MTALPMGDPPGPRRGKAEYPSRSLSPPGASHSSSPRGVASRNAAKHSAVGRPRSLWQTQAGELLAGGVQVGDPAGEVDGEETARERRDDRLVQRRDLRERALLRGEPLAGGAELLGEVGGEHGHRRKEAACTNERGRARRLRPGVDAHREEQVGRHGERRGDDRAAAEQQDAAVDDRQEVHGDEDALAVAGERHHRGGEAARRARSGRTRSTPARAGRGAPARWRARRGVGRDDHAVERRQVALGLAPGSRFTKAVPAEEHRHRDDAEERQPDELAVEPIGAARGSAARPASARRRRRRPRALLDVAGDAEDREVHRDQEAADHAAEEHHHERLDHAGEARRPRRPPRRRRSRRSC